VSIGHRSTLSAFHHRKITLVRDGDMHRLKDATLQPAAE
jgi:putative ATP-binding cassette transporter